MAGYEHVQRLHDSPPEPEFALRGHLAAITCVRFVAAGDQQLVASGDTSGVAKLWSLSARRPVASWSASDQGVLETHEHGGGESLLTQHRDGRIRLWDLDRLGGGAKPEDALSRTLFTDSYFFTRCAVAKSSDCDYVYEPPAPPPPPPPPPPRAKPAGGIGAALNADDDAASEAEARAADDEWREAAVAAHWSGRAGAPRHLVLAPTEPPEAMVLWDTRCDRPALRFQPDGGDRSKVRAGDSPVIGMAMSAKLWLPYGGCGSGTPPLALVGYENGSVMAWDLTALRPRPWSVTPRNVFRSPLMGLDVNREGTVMFAGGVETAARAFALAPGALRPRHDIGLPVSCEAVEEVDRKEGIGQLALRPDGRVLATAGWDFRVRLFSAKAPKFKPLAVLKYHDAAVNALDFSDDSRLLATGSKDQKIALWDVGARFPPRQRGES